MELKGPPRSKAVALRYDDLRDPAPRVVAKGQGKIAEKILEVARRCGVPLHEDPDLVEVLAKVELDQVVPGIRVPSVTVNEETERTLVKSVLPQCSQVSPSPSEPMPTNISDISPQRLHLYS